MSTVNKVIITTIIVIIVVAGGWWLIASMQSNTGNDSSNGTTNGQNGVSGEEVVATITYSGTDFVPASVTVQAGDTIEIVNGSRNLMYFASDEHPTHLDNSELNVGDIEPGGRATFVVTSPGTWGYHDHYNASAGGEIIVE